MFSISLLNFSLTCSFNPFGTSFSGLRQFHHLHVLICTLLNTWEGPSADLWSSLSVPYSFPCSSVLVNSALLDFPEHSAMSPQIRELGSAWVPSPWATAFIVLCLLSWELLFQVFCSVCWWFGWEVKSVPYYCILVRSRSWQYFFFHYPVLNSKINLLGYNNHWKIKWYKIENKNECIPYIKCIWVLFCEALFYYMHTYMCLLDCDIKHIS